MVLFPRMPRNPLDAALREDLKHIITHLHELKGILVANFDELNDRIDTLTTAVDAAKNRIAEDFQALRDQLANDPTDQAAVDAAVSKLDTSIAALDAVDPDPSNPVVQPPAEGEQPV